MSGICHCKFKIWFLSVFLPFTILRIFWGCKEGGGSTQMRIDLPLLVNRQRIISADEDPSLRIEGFAIMNLHGVSTKLN